MLIRRRTSALLAAVAALLVLSACGSSSDGASTATDPSTAPSSSAPTSSAPATQTTAHTNFCKQISPAALRVALDGKSVYDETWAPGKDGQVVGGAHEPKAEYGCAWTTNDGTTATAWLFARPVSADDADPLLAQAARGGCEERQAPAFGSPGVTVQCISDDDTVTRSQGLYGDAWLSCSLQTVGILTQLDRAADWCAAVRDAAID